MVPAFERTKSVNALDRAAAMVGIFVYAYVLCMYIYSDYIKEMSDIETLASETTIVRYWRAVDET
jgi:hypothetical protein